MPVLEKDALEFPSIILGGGVFGGQYNDEQYLKSELPSEVISFAFAHGITAIDTSPFYGASELIIGNAISSASFKAKYPRSSYQLLTKAGRYGAGRRYFDYTPDRIRKSVHDSLAKFRTDYLDVVYLHDCEFVADEIGVANGPCFPIEGLKAENAHNFGLLAPHVDAKAGPGDSVVILAYKALLELKAEGKIRQAGLAGYPLPVLLRLARSIRSHLGPVDVIQTYSHYNLQNRALQAYASAFYEAGVKQITNASPFNMGLLTANGPPYWHPAPPALRDACKTAHKWLASLDGNLAAFTLQSEALRFGLSSALDVAAGGLGIPAVIGCTLPEHIAELVDMRDSLRQSQLRNDQDCQKRQEHITTLIESAGYLDWSWRSPPAYEEAERNA